MREFEWDETVDNEREEVGEAVRRIVEVEVEEEDDEADVEERDRW